MKAVKNDLCTGYLGAPKDWDPAKHGECSALPVALHDGVYYSWWALTWRERFAVLFGRPIRLCVLTSQHPPVMLDLQK